jgi:hypothetical protein
VDSKLEECLTEGIQRLRTFPDLRPQYVIENQPCDGITLRALEVQIFYRLNKKGSVAIFSCRWASLDKTGPQLLESE